MTRTTKVLYIAGSGRSGSTILGQILNQVEGFFLGGELDYFWERGLIENRLCGCGAFFEECPMWRSVLERSFGGSGGGDPEHVLALREHRASNWDLLLKSRHNSRERSSQVQEYLGALGRLYESMQIASDSTVIVDTSKSPAYGYALAHTPGIELRVVHVVRDPRAVSYSWSVRKKRQPASGKKSSRFMTAHNPIESSMLWSASNNLVERIWGNNANRYMLLRYEDFVERPKHAIERILALVGEEKANSPFVGERDVLLEPNHTFSGNPDRLKSGVIALRRDEEWRHQMSNLQRAVVVSATWPGLRRYNYPLWT